MVLLLNEYARTIHTRIYSYLLYLFYAVDLLGDNRQGEPKYVKSRMKSNKINVPIISNDTMAIVSSNVTR